jgi:hypothetical protein
LVIAVLLALAAPAHAGNGEPLLRYLSDDTSFVIVVDVAHARQTPMLQRAFELARGKYTWWGQLAKAGIDLEKSVDTFVVGGEGGLGAGEHHAVAVIDGRLDKLVAAIRKVGKPGPKRAGIDTWTFEGGEVAYVDHRIVVTGPGDLAPVLDRVRGKKRSAGPVAARELLASLGGGTDLAGAIVLDQASRRELGSVLDGEPRGVGFSLAAASQLALAVVLELGDDDAAAKVHTRITSKLDAAARTTLEDQVGKGFSDSLVVAQDHSRVRLSATMTGDEVDKVFALFKFAM